MTPELQLACQVCESGAALDRFRHIIFEEGTLRAFNGVASLEGPSTLDPTEHFAVNETRLATALTACAGDDLKIVSNKEFLVFKQGKLTVRVRKLDASAVFHSRLTRPSREARKPAGSLLFALQRVAPFVSSDASRPWSVSVLLRDGFAWATNNLSIARSPLSEPFTARLPGIVIPLLCSLPKIDWIAQHDQLLTIGSGRTLISFPSSQGDWPDVNHFFKAFPKTLPELDEDLLSATKTVEKFADHFVTLSDASVAGKSKTIESEYEVAVKKGKGTYSARLLSLVLTHATHGDFSSYPAPICFGGDSLQGIAMGLDPKMVTAST